MKQIAKITDIASLNLLWMHNNIKGIERIATFEIQNLSL